MLSEKLRELRKKYGFTQSQLAERLSLSPSIIAMYEQGRRLPDIETLKKIAKFFGVSLEFFLTEKIFFKAKRYCNHHKRLTC